MVRASAESMLISSILNCGDATAARSHGITPEMLSGYREEFEWVQSFHAQYGYMPGVDKLKLVFPDFPFTPGEADPRWSASEVYEHHSKRRLMKAIVKASTLLEDGDVHQAYTEIEGLRYGEVSKRPENLLVDPGYMEDYTSEEDYRLDLPWLTLQGVTGGIGSGELWYWLARLGQGKSSMLIALAVHMAVKGYRVLFIGLEMTKRQIQARSHAVMGHRLGWGEKIDAQSMLHRRYDQRLYARLLGEIAEHVPGELHIIDQSSGRVTPAVVNARAGDYDLVVIDHIGLMHTDGGSRSIEDWRAAAIISNSLKEITGAHRARILCAAQINREGETHGWKPPEMKHAAQTDAIGQDADAAVTMKRYGTHATVCRVAKSRHGESGRMFWTFYKPNVGNFAEITRDYADQIRDDYDDESL